MFFDGQRNLPLVRRQDFKGNVIHFSILKQESVGASLRVYYPQEYTVLVNDILYATASGRSDIDIGQLIKNQQSLDISIYSNDLNPYLLKTSLYKIVDDENQAIEADVVLVNPRDYDEFHNFYISSLIILLVGFSVLFSLYPRSLAEYYRLDRAISARDLDENLIKSRPFTGINVSVYLFISFLLAQLLLSLIHLSELFPEVKLFHAPTYVQSLTNWVLLSLVLFVLIHVKYVILVFFSFLFNLKDFLNSHFLNSVRLTLIFATAFAVLLAATYFILFQYKDSIYSSYYNLFLMASLPIILIIFIKLMAASSFKNLHLFSYLCGTELVPFVVVLSLGID